MDISCMVTRSEVIKGRLVINEVFGNNPYQQNKRDEFLELRFISPSTALSCTLESGLYVYGFGYSLGSRFEVDTVIDVGGITTNKEGLISIGARDSNAMIKLPSTRVEYTSHLKFGLDYNMIPRPRKHPRALMIVSEVKTPLKLTTDKPEIPLNETLINEIQPSVIDMVVFAFRAEGTYCGIFTSLAPTFEGKQYILQVYQPVTASRTLSRCGLETDGFRPEIFRYANPTPSSTNDCKGPRVLPLEELMDRVIPPNADDEPTEKRACYSSFSDRVFGNVRDDMVNSDIANREARARGEQCGLVEGMATHDVTISVASARLRSMGAEGIENEWNTEKHFKPEWAELVERHQSHLIDSKLLNNPDVRTWFVYQIQPNPQESRYMCWLCSKYYDSLALDPANRPVLSHYYLSQEKRTNNQRIRHHFSQVAHMNVIKAIQERKVSVIPDIFAEYNTRLETRLPRFAATANMIRLVYTEVKANIPPEDHRMLVNMLRGFGVSVGTIHDNSEGATSITKSISRQMNQKLIDFMKSNSLPFSLIIDASTDLVGEHVLILYLQLVNDDLPAVMYYRLTSLKDETAKGHVDAIIDAVTNDGWLQEFKAGLIGFGSDGASVMTGKNNGVIKLLGDIVGRQLYGIHCLAHKLHLVTGHAMRDNPKFKDFEQFVNELYVFYGSHSHKRRAHLQQTAVDMGQQFFSLSYIFAVRWVSSELAAVTRIQKSWKVLQEDLKSIAQDKSFKDPVKVHAFKMHNRLISRSTLLYLHYYMDILGMFATHSKIFQTKLGVVIGKEDLIRRMKVSIDVSRDETGEMVKELLDKCGVASVQEYFGSDEITYEDIVLADDEESFESFDSFKALMTKNLDEQIKFYFPEGPLGQFSFLNPEKFPVEFDPSYGITEIAFIAGRFGMDGMTAISEWRKLYDFIANYPKKCGAYSEGTDKIISFWRFYLKESSSLRIPVMKRLLYISLSLPLGSSECERGFSIMNHIKTKRRNRMGLDLLDSLMRIRINGPDHIEMVRAVKYAESFELEGHNLVDRDGRQKRSSKGVEDPLDSKFFPRVPFF